jgi:hypothetical protein
MNYESIMQRAMGKRKRNPIESNRPAAKAYRRKVAKELATLNKQLRQLKRRKAV